MAHVVVMALMYGQARPTTTYHGHAREQCRDGVRRGSRKRSPRTEVPTTRTCNRANWLKVATTKLSQPFRIPSGEFPTHTGRRTTQRHVGSHPSITQPGALTYGRPTTNPTYLAVGRSRATWVLISDSCSHVAFISVIYVTYCYCRR